MRTTSPLMPCLACLMVACSGKPDRSAPARGRDATAPAASRPAPAAQECPAATNLVAIVETARACARSRDGANVGEYGSPLVLENGFLVEAEAGDTWLVTFTEESPGVEGYGRSFVVDAGKSLCDGLAVAVPEITGCAQATAVLEKARQCAAQSPRDGHGVCGGDLLLDDPLISGHRGGSWLVSFIEATPDCAPSGLDLLISGDPLRCDSVPMD